MCCSTVEAYFVYVCAHAAKTLIRKVALLPTGALSALISDASSSRSVSVRSPGPGPSHALKGSISTRQTAASEELCNLKRMQHIWTRLLCRGDRMQQHKNQGFPKLCALPLLPPSCDTSGVFTLNHGVVYSSCIWLPSICVSPCGVFYLFIYCLVKGGLSHQDAGVWV